MAHHVYSTKCFVLSGNAIGENNKFLHLFTRELGSVHAVGRSLRSSHSKLRHHLQDYSDVKVSIVRGREVWRIVGAYESVNLYSEFYKEREKQLLVLRLFSLLSRLLQGEEPDVKLFDLVSGGIEFLKTTGMDTELVRDFEYMFVIRVLSALGYVGEQEELNVFLSPSPFSVEALSRVSSERKKAINAINKALEASGL